jgi:hypothetical protein
MVCKLRNVICTRIRRTSDRIVGFPAGNRTKYLPINRVLPLDQSARYESFYHSTLSSLNYCERYANNSTREQLHSHLFMIQSQSHIATDGQSLSQSWCPAPDDIYYCLIVAVLLLWGALSDERTGLSFVRAIVCSSKSS